MNDSKSQSDETSWLYLNAIVAAIPFQGKTKMTDHIHVYPYWFKCMRIWIAEKVGANGDKEILVNNMAIASDSAAACRKLAQAIAPGLPVKVSTSLQAGDPQP